MKKYDNIIKNHYDDVASNFGASPSSTMEDRSIRNKETELIVTAINQYITSIEAKEDEENTFDLLDVGCGNGYTLSCICDKLTSIHAEGVEYNDNLREIAKNRFSKGEVFIYKGDIRSSTSLPKKKYDVLLCQRVLINILDRADQKIALENLLDLVKHEGLLIFIESFLSGLDALNAARKEFELEATPAAYHNLYLEDDFFVYPQLKQLFFFPENIFSTHYFISRVFHASYTASLNKEGKKNSHFVSFFSQALPDAIGNFSPLRFLTFQKIETLPPQSRINIINPLFCGAAAS